MTDHLRLLLPCLPCHNELYFVLNHEPKKINASFLRLLLVSAIMRKVPNAYDKKEIVHTVESKHSLLASHWVKEMQGTKTTWLSLAGLKEEELWGREASRETGKETATTGPTASRNRTKFSQQPHASQEGHFPDLWKSPEVCHLYFSL